MIISGSGSMFFFSWIQKNDTDLVGHGDKCINSRNYSLHFVGYLQENSCEEGSLINGVGAP